MNSITFRTIIDTYRDFITLGTQKRETELATFVQNRLLPTNYNLNHAYGVKASTTDEITRFLKTMDEAFIDSSHRRIDVDQNTSPLLEAHLAYLGYEPFIDLLLVLVSKLNVDDRDHDIRQIRTDSDWFSLENLTVDALRMPRRSYDLNQVDRDAELLTQIRQETSPPIKWWLAYIDGEPQAFLSSWIGPQKICVIDDLFTHPDFRHRGLATALIKRAVSDCRKGVDCAVLVCTDADDTPKYMYDAFGFEPAALSRGYLKDES